jgi:hypothetical protein
MISYDFGYGRSKRSAAQFNKEEICLIQYDVDVLVVVGAARAWPPAWRGPKGPPRF